MLSLHHVSWCIGVWRYFSISYVVEAYYGIVASHPIHWTEHFSPCFFPSSFLSHQLLLPLSSCIVYFVTLKPHDILIVLEHQDQLRGAITELGFISIASHR
eukprot:TRINITY_DN32977_c0_g1_i1.p2 TRINITY_DN32977_c0_g1~~TRINITY_DN32977_c0_g1_i1.p2  ORF type:complete len:101 (-),score=4.54 TRINITY_DN32977_c0_g1_i1:2479-2781(-)